MPTPTPWARSCTPAGRGGSTGAAQFNVGGVVCELTSERRTRARPRVESRPAKVCVIAHADAMHAGSAPDRARLCAARARSSAGRRGGSARACTDELARGLSLVTLQPVYRSDAVAERKGSRIASQFEAGGVCAMSRASDELAFERASKSIQRSRASSTPMPPCALNSARTGGGSAPPVHAEPACSSNESARSSEELACSSDASARSSNELACCSADRCSQRREDVSDLGQALAYDESRAPSPGRGPDLPRPLGDDAGAGGRSCRKAPCWRADR